MKAQDLRNRTVDELREELRNLKKESFNLRFQGASGDLQNTDRVKQARRDTARVLTVLNEFEKGAEGAAG